MEAGEVPGDMVATNESLRNSYTSSSLIKKNIPGKRIDYILYHPGSKIHVDLKKYNLPLPDRVPNCTFSYSDHEAIETTLVINRKEIPDRIKDLEQKKLVLEESLVVLEEALCRLKTHKIIYLIFSLVLFVILMVSVVLDSPFGYAILFYVLRALITVLMVFTIIMATIWNKIEKHAVLAGKLAIQVTLKRYNVNGNL